MPVSRARPTGSAFLASGLFMDAGVPDGVVEMVLGALVIVLFVVLSLGCVVIALLLSFAVSFLGFDKYCCLLLGLFCVSLFCFKVIA